MVLLDVVGKSKLLPDQDIDPRAEDLPEDSQQWVRLFGLVRESGVQKINAHLYGHLLFLRLMGTRLKASEQWGFVLEPVVGESSGGGSCWASREQYEKSKRVLDPYRKDLVELLGRLGRLAGKD